MSLLFIRAANKKIVRIKKIDANIPGHQTYCIFFYWQIQLMKALMFTNIFKYGFNFYKFILRDKYTKIFWSEHAFNGDEKE
jgi:hypothetical protein